MSEKANERPLVSVIIPIHNTKDYLDKCIKSILAQTLENIEILLIDDASTDGCAVICDQYGKSDMRVKVIHNRTAEGVAAARNRGIKEANGKYIMFLDSDDYVDSSFCEIPSKAAENSNADIVMFNYYSISQGEITEIEGIKNSGAISKAAAHNMTEESIVGPMQWNKIYRKALFTNIKYPEGHKYEDVGTTYKLIEASNSIIGIPNYLYYNNRLREGGITSGKDIETLNDKYEMRFNRLNDLIKLGYDKQNEKNVLQLSYLICMGRKTAKGAEYEKELSRLKVCQDGFSYKQNILLILLKTSPRLFDFVCESTRKRLV